ncbi:MAG: YncE family protein [Bryobacteraceae bacterium]
MIYRRLLIIAALLALSIPAKLLADTPPAPPGITPQQALCVVASLFILTASLSDDQLENLIEKCCPPDSSGIPNCVSTYGVDNLLLYARLVITAHAKQSGQFGAGAGPQPKVLTPKSLVMGTPGSQHSAARDGTPQATTIAATAYPVTVPFRSFGLPPLYGGGALKVTTTCNSALNPTAFWTDHEDALVTRNNMCTGAQIASISVPTRPLQIGITPDGVWTIVTSFDNAISFIQTDTNKVANIIQTDSNTNPDGISISPDGSYALVTNFNNIESSLLVVDIASQSITSTIKLDRAYPQSVFLNPDATLAWVSYPFDNVVEVIDVLTGVLSATVSVPMPVDVVFNATGTLAYISSSPAGSPGSVLLVNTSNYSVMQTIPTGTGASDLMLSLDGGTLNVNNYFDDSVTVINTTTLATKTYNIVGTPRGAVEVPVQ